MDTEALKTKLAHLNKLKKDLAKKQKKLEKHDRVSKAREHVKKTVREQAQLMLDSENTEIVSTSVPKVSFQQRGSDDDFQSNFVPKKPKFVNNSALSVLQSVTPNSPRVITKISPIKSSDGIQRGLDIARDGHIPCDIESKESVISVGHIPESKSSQDCGSISTQDTLENDLFDSEISLDRRVKKSRRSSQQRINSDIKTTSANRINTVIPSSTGSISKSPKLVSRTPILSGSKCQDVIHLSEKDNAENKNKNSKFDDHDSVATDRFESTVVINSLDKGRQEVESQDIEETHEDQVNMGFLNVSTLDIDFPETEEVALVSSKSDELSAIDNTCLVKCDSQVIPVQSHDNSFGNQKLRSRKSINTKISEKDIYSVDKCEAVHISKISESGVKDTEPVTVDLTLDTPNSEESLELNQNPKSTKQAPRKNVDSVLDFSFLDDESGDMYSQIKIRQRRRKRGLSLDSQMDIQFSQEMCDVLSQDDTCEIKSHLPRVFQGLSQSFSIGIQPPVIKPDDPCRSIDPAFNQLDADKRSQENELSQDSCEDSSSQSLIKRSRVRKVPGNHEVSVSIDQRTNLFPKCPENAPSGDIQSEVFSLPEEDYGTLMTEKLSVDDNDKNKKIDAPSGDIQSEAFSLPEEDYGTLMTEKLSVDDNDKNKKIDAKSYKICNESEDNKDDGVMICDSRPAGTPQNYNNNESLIINDSEPSQMTFSESALSESSLSITQTDNIVKYRSSIKVSCEEPLLSVCYDCLALDRGPQDVVVACSALRVLVWSPHGRGWRLAREWTLEHLASECVIGAVLCADLKSALIVTTVKGKTNLTRASLNQGKLDLELLWSTDKLCTNSARHHLKLLHGKDLLIGSDNGNTTHLFSVSVTSQAEAIELESVDCSLNSVTYIDGLPDALLGVSQSVIYIWNFKLGCLLLKIKVDLHILHCPAVYHEKGLLFLIVGVEDPGYKPWCTVLLNPDTEKHCIINGWESSEKSKSDRLVFLESCEDYVCGLHQNGHIMIWSTLSGELLANSTKISIQGPICLHNNRLLVTSKHLIHVYSTLS